MRRFLIIGKPIILLLAWAVAAIAADRPSQPDQRPTIPLACTTLQAQLRSPDDRTLKPEDETRLDTNRIQHALNECGADRSVHLVADGERRAFLSGPLLLPRGTTMEIDKNVVLFASRDARDFQVKQGSCGLVDERGQGCRPLLACVNAPHAGVMGEGVIDGRGSSVILGETYSWWDLRQEARLNSGKVNAPDLLVADRCDQFTVAGLTFRNAASGFIRYQDGDGFVAWGIHVISLLKLKNSGIQTDNARNVKIVHSELSDSR